MQSEKTELTAAECIAALRRCSDFSAELCVDYKYQCSLWNEDRMTDYCKADLMLSAADALEAADKRIAELMPKEGEWVWENYYWHCSACGENPTRGMGYVQGKNELFRVCPNCGSRMAKGEQE